jgi:hypothetical protein
MQDVLFSKRSLLIWHYFTVTDKKCCYKLRNTCKDIQFSSNLSKKNFSRTPEHNAKNCFYCISSLEADTWLCTKLNLHAKWATKLGKIPFVSSKFLKSVLVSKKVLECEDLVYFSFCMYRIWLFILHEVKSLKHSLLAVFFIIIQNSFII